MTKGIFISGEILELSNLSFVEKGLLSIYKYYTEEGKLGCCTMTNESINEQFLQVHINTFKKCKKHLKELGYISTDGGIRVKYVGVNVKPKTKKTTVTKNNNDDKQFNKNTITEEMNEEKVTNDNIEQTDSNFDKVVNNLHNDYRSKEQIKFLEDNYKDMLNKIDYDDFNADFYTKQAMAILSKQFHVYYNPIVNNKKEKEEKIDTTIEF